MNTITFQKPTGEQVIYIVASGKHPVNSQQLGLPVGCKLKYADGAICIHIEGYYLLRRWFYNGKIYDRIAIPEANVYLA